MQLSGHAVEVRVYAEDPARGFLPTGGRSLLLREPTGPGVRVDSGLLQGLTVGTTYDPLLSKVVAHGPDRATALARLDRALAEHVVLGVGTNVAFLRSLLAHPDVRAGRLDTGLVERELDALVVVDVPVTVHVAYALARLLEAPVAPGPWGSTSGWRLSGAAETHWLVGGPGGAPLRVGVTGDVRAALVRVGDQEPVAASAVALEGGLLLTVGGRTSTVLTAVDGAVRWLHVGGTSYAVTELPPEREGAGAGTHDGDVRSPMPGTVIAVGVATGAQVDKGEVVVVVEAMKMEHALTAPFAGVVVELDVRVGDAVVVDQLLAVVVAP